VKAIMAEAMADMPNMIPAKTFLLLTMEGDFSRFMWMVLPFAHLMAI